MLDLRLKNWWGWNIDKSCLLAYMYCWQATLLLGGTFDGSYLVTVHLGDLVQTKRGPNCPLWGFLGRCEMAGNGEEGAALCALYPYSFEAQVCLQIVSTECWFSFFQERSPSSQECLKESWFCEQPEHILMSGMSKKKSTRDYSSRSARREGH